MVTDKFSPSASRLVATLLAFGLVACSSAHVAEGRPGDDPTSDDESSASGDDGASGDSKSGGGRSGGAGSGSGGGVDDVVADGLIDAIDDAPVGVPLTYHGDLRPVIASNCLACHKDEGIAPFTLTSYDDLVDAIVLVIPTVEAGIMPPWSASDDCHPLLGSRALDEETRGMFRRWLDDGMLEGDPDDFVDPELPEDPRASLGDVTQVMEMEKSYVAARIAPGETDEHRCFLLPGSIEKESFMRALEVVPSTRTVHHLQVHRIPPESVAEAEARDAEAEGPGYPCFGDSATGSYNLFSWHPGAEVIRFGEDEAAYLPAGARIALQVHFNIDAYGPDDELPEERTKVNFWLLPEGEYPDYVVVRFFLSGGYISLPAGSPSVVVQQSTVMGQIGVEGGGTFIPGEFVGHTPHMHQLGEEFSVWMEQPGGGSQCLIDATWDFDWQLDYWYPRDQYVPFDADDVVNVRCVYDNSIANQPIVQGVQQAPRQVRFGQSSVDEMCLNHTWVRYEREAYLEARPSQDVMQVPEEDPPADP